MHFVAGACGGKRNCGRGQQRQKRQGLGDSARLIRQNVDAVNYKIVVCPQLEQ
jgi:hypothetical protein